MRAHEPKPSKAATASLYGSPRPSPSAPTSDADRTNGDVLTVRRLKDPAEEKRKLVTLIADLRAIGRPPGGVQERDPFEFPERPGL